MIEFDQRLEAGIDDVGRYADREPALARALVAAFHQHARDGLGAASEDTHLVIDELHVLDVLLVAAEVLAQGLVEGVDRAVALRHRPQRLGVAVDVDLDGGFRDRDEIAQRVVALFDMTRKLSTRKNSGTSPSSRRASSSKEASAPS